MVNFLPQNHEHHICHKTCSLICSSILDTRDPWAQECVVCGPGQVECWQSGEKCKVEKSVSSLLALGLDDGHFLFLIARYQCNANSKHVDVTGSQSDNSLIQLVEIEPIIASHWSPSWWPLIGLMITFRTKWISVIVSTFHWPLLTQDSWDTAWALYWLY